MKKIQLALVVALILPLFTACDWCPCRSLKSDVDSINYAIGYANGCGIRMYELPDTATDAQVNAFIKGFKENFCIKGEEKVKAEAEMLAKFITESFNGHLFNDTSVEVRYGKIIDGMKLVLVRDSTTEMPLSQDEYRNYVYSVMQPFFMTGESVNPTEEQTDSLNLALGVVYGYQVVTTIIPEPDKKLRKLFVDTFEKNLGKVDDAENADYRHGQEVAQTFTRRIEGVEFFLSDEELLRNNDILRRGLIDALKGKTKIFANQEEAQACIMRIQARSQEKMYSGNRQAGEEYLAQVAQNEGVKATESGLLYEVITLGEGITPEIFDTVVVRYEGRLIDGTVFDASQEDQTVSFPVNRVIAGWTEGLQLMPVGSKYRLYIPYNLAYGERQTGHYIKPYSALIFDVELVDVLKADIEIAGAIEE